MAIQAKCEPCAVFFFWGDPYAKDPNIRGDDSKKLAELRCPLCSGELKHGIRRHAKTVVRLSCPPVPKV